VASTAPPEAGDEAIPLAAARRQRRRLEAVSRVMNAVAGWVYVACALFVTVDVLGRKLAGISSQGTTEITGYLLAFGISWSLAHALAERAHIRVDMLLGRMPLALRAWMHGLALAFLVVLAFFFAWRGWAVVAESWEFGARDTSALSIPLVVPQGLWAIGLTVLLALGAVMLLEVVLLLAGGRAGAVDRLLGPRTAAEETADTLEAVGLSGGGVARAGSQR
jgi:TRAP-type mannitol/chloroaromatic compound transport system permease small subunit